LIGVNSFALLNQAAYNEKRQNTIFTYLQLKEGTMSENLQQGIAAFKAGQMEQAREFLRKAAEEEPGNPEAWYYVSFTLDDAERKRRALRYALQLNPNYAEAAEELRKLPQSIPNSGGATISPPTIPPVPPMPGYAMQAPSGIPGAYADHPVYPQEESPSLWGPFAGFGKRCRRTAWIMNDKAGQTEELIQKTRTVLADRQVPSIRVTEEKLINRGISVDNRPYFLLHRDHVTIGLNISQFGKDLFVSITSFIKTRINPFKVVLLAVAVAYWIFFLFLPLIINQSMTNAVNNMLRSLAGMYSSSGYTPSNSLSGLMYLSCILGPFGLFDTAALGIFFVYSFQKWLKEKDFWAGLRNPPNEFDEDDRSALEKTTELVVRQAAGELGLDANTLTPVTDDVEKYLI
jgi:hypothetical protein